MFKRKLRLFTMFAVLIICFYLSGCSENSAVETETDNQEHENFEIKDLKGTPSDYSDSGNWLNIPEITHDTDTFYIYPTCYIDASENAKPICDIDNQQVREQAKKVYEKQATVYEESTNVFAPYYRQSNINAIGDLNNDELEEFQMNEQRTDIYTALDYYFENYNNGRPFIIAGHSQGSTMTKIVLGEYMRAHPEYYERMVAAYPIGYSITKDWLEEHPYIKFAEGADDTGVVVSWNTEGSGNIGKHNVVVEDNAISINPINWKRDETYASSEENLGSRILNEETGEYEIIKGLVDAQVYSKRGVIICTAKGIEFNSATEIFGPESFHGYDYDFYYENLRENVAARIKSYFQQQKNNTD